MKRLRINSQQNDFRSSINRHLMPTEVLERLVKEAEGSAEEEDEEDVEKVGEDPEGTSAGTAVTASSKPKHTYQEQRAYFEAIPADQRTDDDELNLESLLRLSMEFETEKANLRARLALAKTLAKEAGLEGRQSTPQEQEKER
jgi:hypothetical protein